MRVVIDASATVRAMLAEQGLEALPPLELVAPPLLWAEASSVLHELSWRGTISKELAATAFERLLDSPVSMARPPGLDREAWRIADRLGWAKTYDAQYVALARLTPCRLLTVDGRLRRGAARVAEVIGPDELRD